MVSTEPAVVHGSGWKRQVIRITLIEHRVTGRREVHYGHP